MSIMMLMVVPALIALAAAVGAIVLFGQLDKASTTGGRVLLWIGIVLLAVVAFGIGTCYAAVFAGGALRLH
jgi:hypothetical protein